MAENRDSQRKWDLRFLELARMIASWSKDPNTKTGAVIVRPDRTIVSTGYNGFPSAMPDLSDNYENREEKYSRIVHCEMNAVLHAYEPVHGYTLYTWPFASCDRCCVHMIQAGITRMVAPVLPADLIGRWGASLKKTKAYAEESGVIMHEIEDFL